MTYTNESPPSRASSKAVWAGWIIGILPCLMLLSGAAITFAMPQSAVEGMQKFGYPERLLRVLGAIELTCAILYLIPRTAVLGAILMTGYFGGAVATHVRLLDPSFIMPVICGMMVWLGLFLRDRRLRDLLPFRKL